MMEGEGSDGGTDGGKESGGAGLSFRPRAVVFVGKQSFAFVGGRARWRVVVFVRGWGIVSWVLVIRAWGSSSSALSFVVAVGVLGAGLLFMGAGSSFMGGRARPGAVYIVRGWGADVWCRRGVLCCCRVAPFVWLPRRPVGNVAPVSKCEKGWRREVGTYLNEHDGDDASSPSGRCGTSATSSPLSTRCPRS